MDLKIALSGDLPARCSDALAALAPELGMVPAAEGVPVRGHRGAALAVCCDGASVTIEWAQPIQFYRALSLLPRPLAACDIREEPCFETVGMMFDTPRNAVLRPDTLRSFLRKMALMGMNLGMMYTEDTYEVPGQPYFGYQRGRYTYEELHALDDYADMLGIELCPCVQTLGHLNRALHWPAMRRLQDNDEVLLADSEETYSFLRQILTAASAPYRSKRIHIGMDEAHGVGMGAHLRLHGYEKPYDILRRHLKRVLDIVNELGLSPMMWSDMYFRLESPTNGYYDGPMPSQQAVDAVVPGVELVYWDYYHMREVEYDEQLKKHDALHAPTVFAGGIWTWCGPAPDYDKTRTATLAGLSACRKAGVKRYVFASTLYVYGKSGGFYRCSKQSCELYIENYHDMFGLEYTILRYGSLYGPRADRRNAINRFVAEALEKGTITYYGAPTALREYIHVEDAALSTVEILSPEYANQNIVLTGNQPMRVGDLFRMIEEMLGKPIEIKYQHDPNSGHYPITPYAFMPKVGRKMTPHLSTELGQGVLKVMEEIHQELHPDLKELGGYLMVDKAD